MSGPVPSPSMNGTIGLFGTTSSLCASTAIFAPSAGTSMPLKAAIATPCVLYRIRKSQRVYQPPRGVSIVTTGRIRGKKGSDMAIDTAPPLVGVIMGSKSDWETMAHAAETLERLGVPHEVRVVSAHRTPDLLFEYAASAEARGLEVIIAGAGGAAHLPGMTAAKTALPVLGVPVESKALKGVDSLLSIAQMPAGIPVGTLAIGTSGAVNAALF